MSRAIVIAWGRLSACARELHAASAAGGPGGVSYLVIFEKRNDAR